MDIPKKITYRIILIGPNWLAGGSCKIVLWIEHLFREGMIFNGGFN
jgi:hypothetical protein